MAAMLRRRKRFRYVIPLISAVSGALLILFALLFLLFAPTPFDDEAHRHRQADRIGDAAAFRVPRRGWRSSDRDLWTSKKAKLYYGCSEASNKFPKVEEVTHPDRYLAIATSGGLNQQRTGITDAVVAARILNASLVVPKLDQKSFWKDSSEFSEIFDVDYFISSLSKDVKIIKQLPKKGGKTWIPYNMCVPRKCNEKCYQARLLPVLMKKNAVQLTKFDYRLANRLSTDLQKLRCRVNYHALKFTEPIRKMGEKLVRRMRMKSKHYITLHLRFEPDMLAFSGCYYGGGDKERNELGVIRKRWKTLHINNPDKPRRHGRCPLTPEEVGLMLRALGYGSDVHIYVASGEVYGGEETLAPLKALFPNFHSKETIATKEEFEQFYSFSSRMAALDFIVCDESDVFVTNNNGNMAKIIAGRRRYFGHKRTIRPNGKKLYRLFLNKENTTWEAFASSVRSYQRGFMGEPHESRPGRGEFHENPSACICENSQNKVLSYVEFTKLGKGSNVTSQDEVQADVQDSEDDPEGPDSDDDEDLIVPLENDQLNKTTEDYETATSEEPEIEELYLTKQIYHDLCTLASSYQSH